MSVFNFNEAIDASTKPLMQFNGVEVKIPDGRTVYAHRGYLNKLFKDSGYKGVSTVHSVYEIVGNTDKMDHLNIDDKVIVIEEGEVNFIYLKKSSYNNISTILSGIESKYKPLWRGDLQDYTQFEGIFKVGKQEYVLQVNLVNEWANLYTARHTSNNNLYPTVVAMVQLEDETAVGSILDSLVDNAEPIDVVGKVGTIRVNDLINILQSTGMIKYNGKKRVFVSRTDNESVLEHLVHWLEKINATKWRMRYTTPAGVSYEALVGVINYWYAMAVDHLAEDVPFAICDYLWATTKLAQSLED